MQLLQSLHLAQQNVLCRAVPGAIFVRVMGQPPKGCSHVRGTEPVGLGKAPMLITDPCDGSCPRAVTSTDLCLRYLRGIDRSVGQLMHIHLPAPMRRAGSDS